MAKQFHYGGQAVIEGIMIRGQKYLVTAVRRSDGEIVIDKQSLPTLYTGWIRSAPMLRGVIVLIESLVLGIKALMYSANVALDEEGAHISNAWVWLMLVVSLGFSVALFFLAPLFLTGLFHIGSSLLFNLVEGLIRLAIFVIYLRLVTLMPDIKRVFAYHGAEHKTVNGYESGASLEVEALKKYSKAHIRCGGSFLVVVLIIAVLVFALVGRPALWLMVVSRVALVPVIAALGYEVIYFGARHSHNIFIRILLAPGLWIQSFTTSEPDNQQLEVAVAAMKTAIESDQEIVAPATTNS